MTKSRDLGNVAQTVAVNLPTSLGTAGQSLVVNSGADGLEFGAASGGGVTVYTGLSGTDGTPSGATYLLNASSPSAGDLAYVTANTSLYQNNGNGWYRIAVINTTPTISSVADASSNTTPFTLTAGTNTVITVTASDVDEGTDLTYSHSVTSGSLNGTTVTQGTGASENVFTITPHASNATTFSLTFTVSDSINAATSVAAFTLEFSIADSHYTSLLVATDAASGDNNDITDSSSNAYTITASGDAHAGTFSPYRHGGYSALFDGTSDYIQVPASAFALSTGDFTIETYIYFNSITTGAVSDSFQYIIYDARASQSATDHFMTITTSGDVRIRMDGIRTIELDETLEAGKWYHLALVNSGGTVTLFLNGTADATTFSTNSNLSIGSAVEIGGSTNDNNYWLDGYLRDFRVLIGTALYTSNFTPPTEPLTAITNTSLLTCHLPYISDGSSNGHTITVNGNTSTEPIGPYDHNEYSESDNGGSVYFDGTGDYVRISSIADLSSGSWTIEGWYYFEDDPNVPANTVLWTLNSQATLGYALMNLNGANLVLQQRGTSTYTSSAAYDFDVNRWYHIAAVWNNSANTMRAYVNGEQVIASTTNPIQNAGNGFTLGADGYGALPFKGFTSDFRIKQTAEYTAEFTPPTAPLSSSGTVLHIKGTDAHVLDKSQGNNLKLVGNAAAVTNATNNSNISSTNAMYFDGSGDYVDVPASANWGFGNGAWTVEFWINTTDTDFDPVSAFNPSSPFTGWGIRIESGLVKLFVSDGSSSDGFDTVSGTTTVNDGSWHHVALTSASGSNAVSCYVDGTLAGSHTFTVAISSTGQALRVGADTNTSIQRPLNGYMQDLRITKGLARYTSNFTVPSAHLKG